MALVGGSPYLIPPSLGIPRSTRYMLYTLQEMSYTNKRPAEPGSLFTNDIKAKGLKALPRGAGQRCELLTRCPRGRAAREEGHIYGYCYCGQIRGSHRVTGNVKTST